MSADDIDRAIAEQRKRACRPRLNNRECREAGLEEHAYLVVDAEYDSLANGGSYDILECQNCRRRAFSMMPD